MGCQRLPLDGPHSRACGMMAHDHGPMCQSDCPTCSGTEKPTAGSVTSEIREPSTVGSGASIAIPATVLYSRLRAITIAVGDLQRVPTTHWPPQWKSLDIVIEQLLGLLQDYQDAAFLAELAAQQTDSLRMRLTELRGLDG